MLSMLPQTGLAQPSTNAYGLYVISSLYELQRTIAADSNGAFVQLTDYAPSIVLDIKYGTAQNVFYEKLYDTSYALTRLPVARALAAAQKEFEQQGKGLKVYDAYRPYSVTCYMF